MSAEDNHQDWAEILTGEGLLLGMLGKMLYTSPNRDWLQELAQGDLFTEAPFGGDQPLVQQGMEIMQTWCQENQDGVSDQTLDAIQQDYLRLFIGVGKVLAPAWESVYFNEDRLIFQEQTLQVRQWYRRYHVEAEKIHKEPDDHLGLELIFLSYLAQLALEDLQRKDDLAFAKHIEAQQQFLREHLLLFAPKWDELVEKHAATDFYRALGRMILGSLLAADQLFQSNLTAGAEL